jgi:uncharacterized protein (TIGR03437 family)
MRSSFRISLVTIYYWVLIVAGPGASAQTQNPNAIIGGVGNSLPTLPVAPGQLVTFFVPNSGVILPVPYKSQQKTLPLSLAGFSAIFRLVTDTPMPILMVQSVSTCTVQAVPPPGGGLTSDSSCGGTIAVTVQIPFGIVTLSPLSTSGIPYASKVAVAINGMTGPSIDVLPVSDQVHFLTSCDLITPAPTAYVVPNGLSCPPLVKHGDGTTVSPRSPAKSGEELVAYAIGFGQTDPPMTTGQAATGSAISALDVDFNYRPNAFATRPTVPSSSVVYAGATPGYAGLYQINFIVPPPPAGLAPCVDWATSSPGTNVVQTNLTVSIGLLYSFDGAGFCVQPN